MNRYRAGNRYSLNNLLSDDFGIGVLAALKGKGVVVNTKELGLMAIRICRILRCLASSSFIEPRRCQIISLAMLQCNKLYDTDFPRTTFEPPSCTYAETLIFHSVLDHAPRGPPLFRLGNAWRTLSPPCSIALSLFKHRTYQWLNVLLLFNLLLFKIFLPFFVFERLKKPCRRLRTKCEGLNVSRGPPKADVLEKERV